MTTAPAPRPARHPHATGPAVSDRWSVALAVGLVLAGQLMGRMLSGRGPFGTHWGEVGDQWHQMLPFSSQMRQVLLGQGPSTLLFNWNSALGAGWLADWATYLASPFNLVLLLPLDLQLAVWLVVLARQCAAAAAMVMLLLTLRRGGSWWLAALLSAGYAQCGWALLNAGYLTMWLDGLVSLPVLALVGLWSVQRRRFLLGVAAVAWCFWSNYYTAWMEALGATLLMLPVLAHGGHFDEDGANELNGGWPGCKALGRFALRGVLGASCTLVLLWPTLQAVLAAQPTPSASFRPVDGWLLAGRLVTGTLDVNGSPGLNLVTPAVVLALTLCFSGQALRRHGCYMLVCVLTLLSLNWGPSQRVWHLFDVPDGNAYRSAFVVCGMVVVLAWLAVPTAQPATLAPAAVAYLMLCGGAWLWAGHPIMTGVTAVFLSLWAVVGLVLLAARRRWCTLRAVLVLGVGLVEFSLMTATSQAFLAEHITGSGDWQELRSEVGSGQEWPQHRAPLPSGGNANLPALAGVAGTAYYSSTTEAGTAQTAKALGLSWWAAGRAWREPDQVLGMLLGQQSTLTPPGGGHLRGAPVVRLDPVASRGMDTTSVFAARNQLAGGELYVIPQLSRLLNGSQIPVRAGSSLRGDVTLLARCPVGSLVQLDLPSAPASAVRPGPGPNGSRSGPLAAVPDAVPGQSSPGVMTWGWAPANGKLQIQVHQADELVLNPDAVGCLDPAALRRILQRQREPDHLVVRGGLVRAGFQAPASGDLVVSSLERPGWWCSADGSPAPTVQRGGLLVVPVEGAHEVVCRFRQPGLGAGLVGSLVSLAVAIALAGAKRIRSRRSGFNRQGAPKG